MRWHVWLTGPLFGLVLFASSSSSASALLDVDGPPPPVPPAVISRDAAGHATLRAVRIAAPLVLDGILDEDAYRTTEPVSHFIQAEPNVGAEETEKTEMWIFFDRDTFYVTFRCWDSHPEREVANDMRRDSLNIAQNEHVSFILDTFHDRRNMLAFNVSPLGGRIDGQMTNETQWNPDFNPIWRVATSRFEHGWIVECAVPFKSLRYRPSTEQVWGFNARRVVRWKNEISHVVPMPAKGLGALSLTSLAPTLVGVEAPPASRNLEIKPYAISGLTTDLTATPRLSNHGHADAGVDVKYGITQNVTTDFTYRTDFAQVEADEQQVNLTRFSLFFPEKREFFLENQGTFAFGGASSTSGSDTPVLFYSRRIGLSGTREVPLLGGGRLTGRVGRFTLGALNIQSTAAPEALAQATNFSVVRIKRDLFRASSVGVMATHRSRAQSGLGSNDAYGVDAGFKFFDNLYLNSYWARTRTTGVQSGDTSYRLQLDYPADRYGVQLEHLYVGDHFNPDVGFVRRSDMRKSYGFARFSPRTNNSHWIRKYTWDGSFTYIQNGAGIVESRDWVGDFAIDFHNSDRLTATVTNNQDYLPQPFRIAAGVTLPVGRYDFSSAQAGYTFGTHRKISGAFTIERGQFYDGRRTVLGVSGGRVEITPQFSLQPTLSVNWVDLSEGSFRTTLAGSRVTYTMTPLMFVSALVQYNSSANAMASNVRLRWEYQPGSELFIVYNEQRDTLAPRFPELANRAVIVKVNKLLRF